MVAFKRILLVFICLISLGSTASGFAYPPKIIPGDPHARRLYMNPNLDTVFATATPKSKDKIYLPIKISNLKNPQEWQRWKEETELLVGAIPLAFFSVVNPPIASLASNTLSIGGSLAIDSAASTIISPVAGVGTSLGLSIPAALEGSLAVPASLAAGVGGATSSVASSVVGSAASGSAIPTSIVGGSISSLPAGVASLGSGIVSAGISAIGTTVAAASAIGSTASLAASPIAGTVASLVATPVVSSIGASSIATPSLSALGSIPAGFASATVEAGLPYVGFTLLYVD